MAGDIKLKIGADTSELERAFGNLIKKIQGDADKLKLTPSAAKNAPSGSEGYRVQQDAFKAVRAQEQKAKTELDAIKMTKEGLEKIDRQLATNARNESKNDRDKQFAEKERNRLISERITLQGTLNKLENDSKKSRTLPGGGGGGSAGTILGSMPKGGITGVSSAVSALGPEALAVGAIIGTLVAAIKAIEGARVLFSQTDNRIRVAEATAFNIQGQGGQRLESFFNGGAPQEFLFNKQREQAAGIAQTTMQNNLAERNRGGRLLSHPLELLNEGIKDASFQYFNPFGKEIAAKRNIEQGKIQEEQFNAIKNGPAGKIQTEVSNKYVRDWQRNLQFERQMGLNNESFRGTGGGSGFLGGVNAAGFTDEQGMGAASRTMAAGGSTRASKGNAAFALQMGRQFDLTNAPEAIASISKQLGSSEMSKEALIKIQSEGTRIGINQADFVEENRRFVEMASNVIGSSNATSGAGLDQVLRTFSKFAGGQDTMSGLESAKTAYDLYQKQSNTQTGPSAVMRAAGMRQDKTLGQLNERDRAKLSLMPELEITTDSQVIQEMASRHKNMSPQQIVDSMHGVIGKSMFVNKTTDEAVSRLRKAYQGASGPLASGQAYGDQLTNINNAEGALTGEIGLEGIGGGQSEKVRRALGKGLAAGDPGALQKMQDEIKKEAESNKSNRPEDETNKQMAESSRMANEMFISIQKSILPAAAETARFTARINDLVAAMAGGNAMKIKSAMDALGPNAPGGQLAPTDQSHATVGGAPVGR